jgi:acyl carrier protein
MTPDEIRDQVLSVLALELAVPADRLAPELLLVEDLGLDSLAAVRLLAAVEQHFGVALVGTDYVHVESVADLVGAVQRALAEPVSS